jgi:hypothetical protein
MTPGSPRKEIVLGPSRRASISQQAAWTPPTDHFRRPHVWIPKKNPRLDIPFQNFPFNPVSSLSLAGREGKSALRLFAPSFGDQRHGRHSTLPVGTYGRARKKTRYRENFAKFTCSHKLSSNLNNKT